MNRAVDICRYYRSTFEVVQESVSDSDCVSSILAKIWDLAATSKQGLAVRDAYRHIKALSRCAKEQGRSVAAYTTDLYYQLEKMGRGSVQRIGRLVRFVVGETNPPDTWTPDGVAEVTEVTVNETTVTQGLEVSLSDLVSPVTQQDLEQMNTTTCEVGETQSLPGGLDTKPRMENIIHRFHPSDEPTDAPGGEILTEVEPVSCSRIPWGDEMHLPSEDEIQSWLDSIATAQSADECMNCIDALNQLPPSVKELILINAKNLLPRFWEILDQGQHKAGSGEGNKVSAQQHQEISQNCSRITPPESVEKPANPNATDYAKNLITGLWVRTVDNFYGHLSAMQPDGRWWVKSPKSRNSDAQSRLYAAADIIPMPVEFGDKKMGGSFNPNRSSVMHNQHTDEAIAHFSSLPPTS